MTDHDQRVCLRCGKPAGDHRFCESCCSQLDSFRTSLTRVAVADRPDSAGAEPAQPPPGVARLEEVLTPKDVDAELAACLRADAAGEPQGATNLGVLLEERGDLQGALAAYRRADRRGDVDGSFNLGCLLAEMGDLPGARAALERADERGDGSGAANLGVLLEQEGDLQGALAAYRRADERGDAVGAFNLGLSLAARGDLEGARAAYGRAAERGDPEVREQAAEADAAITPAEVESEPAVKPDPEPEPRTHEGASPPRRRWIVALCVLGLVALLIARGRRRSRRR